MSKSLDRLLQELAAAVDWSSAAGGFQPPVWRDLDTAWATMLRFHNGFSAFNGGLRVFGTGAILLPDLDDWNSQELWRGEYHGFGDGLFFFAEDFLGNQFGFDSEQRVFRFLAETGESEVCGQDFQGWLEKLLADPTEELSLWLLSDWLCLHPKPNLSEHLCAKIPFVAHGATAPGNMYACGRLESMRFKGSFAHQIRKVPNGGQIKLSITNSGK